MNADALSRFPANPQSTDNGWNEEIGTATTPVTSAIELAPVGEENFARGEWEEAQTADPDINVIRRYVKSRTMSQKSERQALSAGAQKLLQQ